MTDLASLLVAIRANPDDDTLRLVYADAMEEDAQENPVRIPCFASGCGVKCKPGYVVVNSGRTYRHGEPREATCEHCGGAGTVPDPLRAAHAELIRVQVATAAQRAGRVVASPMNDREQEALEWRELELLRQYRKRWETLPCHNCDGSGEVQWERSSSPVMCPYCVRGDSLGCPACRGVHPLGCIACEGHMRLQVEWVRGWPLVQCRLRDVAVEYTVPLHAGQRHATSWAGSLLDWCEGFVLTDRRPLVWRARHLGESRVVWSATNHNGWNREDTLPDEVFGLLQGYEPGVPDGTRQYLNRTTAKLALARALWWFVKGRLHPPMGNGILVHRKEGAQQHATNY